MNIMYTIGNCSLGSVLVASSERGICAIFLGDEAQVLVRDLEKLFPRAKLTTGDAAYDEVLATVVAFIEAPASGLNLPLDLTGTEFQLRVWQALAQLPTGATATYSDLARQIGSPNAVRAVANASARNVLAVAIPCHRVIGRDGSLTGYRWGIERKRALLEREAQS